MPVSRAYITPYATTDPNQFQALTDLANFSDGLEKAAGVRVGSTATSASTATPAPASASWTITAANGHFLVQITNPAASGNQAIIQHQIASATNTGFDANSTSTTYTLGFGETTRDIVDPGATKYWRIQSRYSGSAWNAWLLYSTTAGVVALSSGTLATA